MALIEKLLGWPAATPVQGSTWTDPAWWGGAESVAGVAVDPDTALKISTVYACVGLLSETIASLPLVLYRYTENELGRQRAKSHPLYEVLHDQPNDIQTAFDFIQMTQAHALMRGSGYARIQAGPRGFADQLIPYHPDKVQKEKLSNGKIRYRLTDDFGKTETVNQEDVFEVGGLSLDGWNTVSVVSYARDSMGLTLAAERYGGRFFRNDTRPGGVLRTEGRLSDKGAQKLKASWEAAHSGANQHRVAVLEEGLQWQQIGISPEDAQFLQTREFQAEDVCRWFRVPPHMVGLTSKATSWGSGIEQMSIGFVTYTLRPWLTRWTQAIRRDLLLAPQTYFADFVVEHLLRGDITSRYNAYAIARQWGWLSVNEIRRYENLNPVGGGDTYLQPMNMEPSGGAPLRGELLTSGVNAHYRLLAEESAARLVRKEIAACTRLAKEDNWAGQVADFYQAHAALVAQAMRMSMAKAMAYCETGQARLMAEGPGALEDWEPRRVLELADLATGDNDEQRATV
jgi:HK97 family phage portal protein